MKKRRIWTHNSCMRICMHNLYTTKYSSPLEEEEVLVRYTIPSVIYIHRIRLNTPVNACKFSKKWRSKGTIHKWGIVQTEFICQETPPSLLKYHMNFKFIRFVQIQTDEYKSDISCFDEKLIFFVILWIFCMLILIY